MKLFPIFPVNDQGHCTCYKGADCTTISKHPAVKGWQHGIEGFLPAPGQSYGIVTGSANGIFVVDCDSDEAVEHFKSLGPLPPTFTVKTSRGVHFYFALPPGTMVLNSVGRKFDHLKIDVRGENGFVLGPGSRHKSGFIYAAMNDLPPAPAPAWVLERAQMDATERRAAAVTAPKPIDGASEEGQRRISLAIEYLQTCEPSVQGENGSGALWLAAVQLMRTYELHLDDALALLQEVYNPRCQPQWSDAELVHKLEDGRDRSDRLPGCPSAAFPGNLMTAAHAPTPSPASQGPRKRHDPEHRYTFTPGDRPNGQKTKISLGNILAELDTHPSWAGVLQYDEFRRRIRAVDPPMKMDAEDVHKGLTNEDATKVEAWFEVASMYTVPKDTAYKAAAAIATKNAFHPVKEYLDTVGYGPTAILDDLATRTLGCNDTVANDFLRKTLIAAVRRIRRPGCQMDTVLVLVGKQGARKSTFIRELFGKEFTRSQMPDLATKDAAQALQGFWCIELAELSRILNTPSSTVKEFLTRQFDDYRPAYGRVDVRFARECVLIASTNDDDFLVDATGNRRYLPITCKGKIDIAFIVKHRDAIWAAANALEAAGEAHWFEDESSVDGAREAYRHEDAWEGPIRLYLQGRHEVTVQEVYEQVILNGDKDLSKLDRRVQMRLADILKKTGASREGRVRGSRQWRVSAEMAAMEMKKMGRAGLTVVQGGVK